MHANGVTKTCRLMPPSLPDRDTLLNEKCMIDGDEKLNFAKNFALIKLETQNFASYYRFLGTSKKEYFIFLPNLRN